MYILFVRVEKERSGQQHRVLGETKEVRERYWTRWNTKLPDVERIESVGRTTFYDPSFVRANIGFLSSSPLAALESIVL